jgi:ketosteroid isomerase-like protein
MIPPRRDGDEGELVMMRWNIAGLALAAVVAATSAGAAPVSTEARATEARIRDLEAKVNSAYAANDLPTYFSFYADDLRALFPEGPTTLPAYRAEWTAFIRGGGAILSFKDSDMRVQVSPRGDAAVASYLASVTTRTPGKGDATTPYAETDVWFLRHGQWKIVEIHYSETPAPPAK